MRLFEIADAAEQLALLRLIFDNTWTAIAQQAEQQRIESAKRAAATKQKPRRTKARKVGRIAKPPLPSSPAKKPLPPSVQQAAKPTAQRQSVFAIQQHQTANRNATRPNTNVSGTAQTPNLAPRATSNSLQKTQISPKTVPNSAEKYAVNAYGMTNGRHSLNRYSTPKKLPRKF